MKTWAMFWAVGVIWGSSFMLIRIGVEWVHPVHLVFVRVAIAALGLAAVVIGTRQRIPHDPRTLLALIVIGLGNNVLPFMLISWGEQTVESGLASVLQSTAALFTLVVAHFAFADERINLKKTLGLMCGFIGVVVLAARNWQDGQVITSSLAGQLAIVGASLAYATFTTFSRKILNQQSDPAQRVAPVVVALITLLTAAISTGAMSVIGGQAGLLPPTLPPDMPASVLLAVLVLGFVNTFVAYLMYYEIVKTLGASRASMVTYIVPVVGLLLGVLFLSEPLDAFILLGAALIFTGIGIVNLRLWGGQRQAKPAAAGD